MVSLQSDMYWPNNNYRTSELEVKHYKHVGIMWAMTSLDKTRIIGQKKDNSRSIICTQTRNE